MATCKQCREFEKCKDDAFINGAKFDPNESVKYCTGFEPITNADRIRSMTDDELAEFLCEVNGCYQANCPGAELCKFGGGLANGLKKWLQQPAEEVLADG